jgi:hypothetical protein
VQICVTRSGVKTLSSGDGNVLQLVDHPVSCRHARNALRQNRFNRSHECRILLMFGT